MFVLAKKQNIYVAPSNEAGGNRIHFVPKWYHYDNTSPDLNKHSQLLHLALLSTSSSPWSSRSTKQCHRIALEIALHLCFHLCAGMTLKSQRCDALHVGISHSSIISPSNAHRGLSSPSAVTAYCRWRQTVTTSSVNSTCVGDSRTFTSLL